MKKAFIKFFVVASWIVISALYAVFVLIIIDLIIWVAKILEALKYDIDRWILKHNKKTK